MRQVPSLCSAEYRDICVIGIRKYRQSGFDKRTHKGYEIIHSISCFLIILYQYISSRLKCLQLMSSVNSKLGRYSLCVISLIFAVPNVRLTFFSVSITRKRTED